MKIVLIGAGSYVFAPTVLRDAIEAHRLDGSELVMVDLNAEAAEDMAGVGRAMAAAEGVDCTVTAATDRRAVMPGADFVLLSASPQGFRRWEMDVEILKKHGLAHQARECGGLVGLSNGLRSITLALDVARDMEALCPSAMLLDVTNPMPRVVTAVNRYSSITCYGFCSVALGGSHKHYRVARLLERDPDELEVVSAGLNHFSWLASVRDKRTGEDLYPAVEKVYREGEGHNFDVFRSWLDAYGGISLSGVHHTAEYLPQIEGVDFGENPPYHGTPEEREKNTQTLKAVAAGDMDWREVFAHGSWEHPMDVAAALKGGKPGYAAAINLRNDGNLPQLPDGRVVEVPANITTDGVQGLKEIRLPDGVAEICKAVSDVHELVAAGAARGDRSALEKAVQTDPAIVDKDSAQAALAEMLQAHADMLPQFSNG